MERHLRRKHGRETWGNVPRRNKPNSHAKMVMLQTFFSHPYIQWFTVNKRKSHSSGKEDTRNIERNFGNTDNILNSQPTAQRGSTVAVESDALWTTLEGGTQYTPKLGEEQQMEAPSLHAKNAGPSHLLRLPLEIRDQIYKMVLPAGVVYHIVHQSALVKPDL